VDSTSLSLMIAQTKTKRHNVIVPLLCFSFPSTKWSSHDLFFSSSFFFVALRSGPSILCFLIPPPPKYFRFLSLFVFSGPIGRKDPASHHLTLLSPQQQSFLRNLSLLYRFFDFLRRPLVTFLFLFFWSPRFAN